MNGLKHLLIAVLSGAGITFAAALLAVVCGELFLEKALAPAGGREATGSLVNLSIAIGVVTGSLFACLSRYFTRAEAGILAVLAGIAAGSIGIMLGKYDSDSLMPVAIYGIALINGVMISPVCRFLTELLKDNQGGRVAGQTE